MEVFILNADVLFAPIYPRIMAKSFFIAEFQELQKKNKAEKNADIHHAVVSL